MRDFDDSTLWRLSEFERVRRETGTSGFARLDGPTLLSSTLMADLHRLDPSLTGDLDVLEVMAACLRHREPALLYLSLDGLVWPVTLFPNHGLYHSPRDLAIATPSSLASIALAHIEPPGVQPPGHWMHERVARNDQYRPLAPLAWAMAMHGPRGRLLLEIGGTAAYRCTRYPPEAGLVASGAMGSAAERLRRESVPLRDIAAWPGMSLERASRLINALYLTSALMVSRAHPAARSDAGLVRNLLSLRRPRR